MNIFKSAADAVLGILELAIFVRAIISWLPIPQKSRFVSILYLVTEPLLAPIRRLLNRSSRSGSGMMMDLSPIVAILLLGVLRNVLRWLL